MKQHQILALAYGSLMALIFAGTYVLEDYWMAYLLLLPSFLIFRAMGASPPGSGRSSGSRRAAGGSPRRPWPQRTRGLRRVVRIGLTFAALTVSAALLLRAFGLADPVMSLVLIPLLLLGSLVDREYFGWSDPSEGSDRPLIG
jgi:hypothetical protein